MATTFFADDYLSSWQDGICSYISEIATKHHEHDYYEMFLIVRGSSIHYVNTVSIPVNPGTLCFIRPTDRHCFEKGTCDMYNVLVRTKVIESIRSFLGENQTFQNLLSTDIPIHINLDTSDFEALAQLIQKDIIIPHATDQYYNAHFRAVVIAILEKYFEYPFANTVFIPSWFELLLKEMQSERNYSEGLPALYRISMYSPEYICRTFKTYLNTSPTAYINNLRIQAAGKYLVYTDDDIIDIAYRCGFNTMSHFYHQFRKVYKESPLQYRKAHKFQRNPLIPELTSQ